MTIEEIIEKIEDVLSSDYHYDGTLVYQLTLDDFDWLKMARQALEKQIPKKPDIYGDGYDDNGNLIYDMYDCPNCDTSYEMDYEKYNYCPSCGQALDWSEGNG